MSEITYYPLTQSQQLMFFQLKYSMQKQVVNICIDIELEAEIDRRLMMEALYLSLLRCHAAAIRLHKFDKEIKQYFSDAAPDKIEYLDFSEKTEQELEESYATWSGTPFPNGHMDTQLYVVKLIKKPNGHFAVYGCFSHTIFDAYSVSMTFKDILAVYYALRDHTVLPKDFPSPLPAYEADFRYQGSEKEKADLEYFKTDVFDTEPQFTCIGGRSDKLFPKKTRDGKTVDLLKLKGSSLDLLIKPEVVEAVNTFAQSNKVSPQALYMLALRSYLAMVCETTDVMFNNSIARRATLAQKRAGGTMINALPIRFRFDNELNFAEACQSVYTTQCEIYRHANLSTSLTLNMLREKFHYGPFNSYSTIGFTYQPYFMLDDHEIPFSFRRLPNGIETLMLYMSIVPFNSAGDFGIDYSYKVGFTKEEDIRKLHAFMERFLLAGTAAPQKKLSELMN